MNLCCHALSVIGLVGFAGSYAGGVALEDSSAKLFRQNCMSCHQAPDLAYPTDRAWLERASSTVRRLEPRDDQAVYEP